jgi:hypothetical protein
MGRISGNIELFEFDSQSELYEDFRRVAAAAGLGELVERIEAGYLEESPKGIHWLVRCSEIGGNTKLARRPKRPEEMEHSGDIIQVLIETRGEGGYAVLAPSHGPVHPSGKAYELRRGDSTRSRRSRRTNGKHCSP